jgi:hypothetical protein
MQIEAPSGRSSGRTGTAVRSTRESRLRQIEFRGASATNSLRHVLVSQPAAVSIKQRWSITMKLLRRAEI